MSEENTSTTPSVPPAPQAPAPKKRQTWKTVLTIVFLVFFWPIGIILIWTIAPWRKKVKIIVTVVFVVLPLIFIIGTVPLLWMAGGAKNAVSDAYCRASIAQILPLAELYYNQEQSYNGVNCFHPEISVICNNIKEVIGEEPIINADQDAFCVYIKLSSGAYFCRDSQALTYEGAVNPGGTGYCDGQTFVCPK